MADSSFAILDDLTGVAETTDGFGVFLSEKAAQQALVYLLESNKSDLQFNLTKAKRRLRAIINRNDS